MCVVYELNTVTTPCTFSPCQPCLQQTVPLNGLWAGAVEPLWGGGSFITPLNLMVQFAWIMFCVLALRKKKEQTLQKYLIYFDKVQKRSANLHICKPERFKYYSIISIFSVSQLYSVFISINNTSGNYAILYILYLKRGKCFFVSFTSRIN